MKTKKKFYKTQDDDQDESFIEQTGLNDENKENRYSQRRKKMLGRIDDDEEDIRYVRIYTYTMNMSNE